MINLTIIVLILLGIVAVIDWKVKAIPSFFLTAIILVTAMVHFYDFEVGLIHLVFGTLSFIFAMMLYESNFFGGIADVKVLTIIGLMITNWQYLFTMMILTMVYGVAYKLVFRYVLKKKPKDEIPFIPCLLGVYVALMIIGGVA